MRYVLWLWASLSGIAHAEESPKYLLRDAGVRVDLTSEWRASEWTPDHLQADRVDGKAKLYAWSTPGQLEIVPADLPGWAHVYEAMLGNLKAKDPALKSSEVKTLGGRPTARVDLVFEESGRKGIAAGGSVSVAGRTLHVAVVGLADKSSLADATIDGILDRLDVRNPAAPRKAGEPVSGGGMTIPLPPGFFPPLPEEDADLHARVEKLGLIQLEGCWLAVRPLAGAAPDLLMGCPSSATLGIVDEASFADADVDLRQRLFGKAPVGPATSLRAGDRIAFLYKLDLAENALRVAVVPTHSGLERVWALGTPDRASALEAMLTDAVLPAVFEGQHPVGVGDRVGYYLAYQPTSAYVIGPGIAALAAIVAAIRLLARPRTSPVDDIA